MPLRPVDADPTGPTAEIIAPSVGLSIPTFLCRENKGPTTRARTSSEIVSSLGSKMRRGYCGYGRGLFVSASKHRQRLVSSEAVKI